MDLSLRIILPLFYTLCPSFSSALWIMVEKALSHLSCVTQKIPGPSAALPANAYYIDAGEPEPEKKKGLARLRSFLKPTRDANIRYQKPKPRKVEKSPPVPKPTPKGKPQETT